MVVQCSLKECKNSAKRDSEEVTFHSFPSNEEVRKIWCDFANKRVEDWKNTWRLCSDHFAAEDIIQKPPYSQVPGRSTSSLIENAIPRFRTKSEKTIYDEQRSEQKQAEGKRASDEYLESVYKKIRMEKEQVEEEAHLDEEDSFVDPNEALEISFRTTSSANQSFQIEDEEDCESSEGEVDVLHLDMSKE